MPPARRRQRSRELAEPNRNVRPRVVAAEFSFPAHDNAPSTSNAPLHTLAPSVSARRQREPVQFQRNVRPRGATFLMPRPMNLPPSGLGFHPDSAGSSGLFSTTPQLSRTRRYVVTS